MDSIHFGIVTVSDSCYLDNIKDRSGPNLQQEIEKVFKNATFNKVIIPDDKDVIISTFHKLCNAGCDVIFTTGGTGFSPRDVTPEATKEFITKEANGLSYALISKSLEVTEMAMLSRPVCGIHGKTLILNFPGSAKAAVECFSFVKNVIPHAIAVLCDKKTEILKQHDIIQKESLIRNPTSLDTTESKVKLNNVVGRKRVSPYKMLEVDEALKIILTKCFPTTATEIIPYKVTLNRILAEDIYATEPIPPFRAAIKDGYAGISTDNTSIRKVVKYVAAGDENKEIVLQMGEVIRISTGAAVPTGADIVIPVENTYVKETAHGEEMYIGISEMDKGKNIREIGSDVAVNTVVLNKFDRISYSHVGVMASLGKTQVEVFKQPVIGVLSSGNEIVDPNDPIKPGQIRDSNKSTLINLLKRYGYSSEDLGVVRDEPNMIKVVLSQCFRKCDVLITTGGMSMGEFDVLKDVLIEDFQATIHFGRINMKPGKPTAFATLDFNGSTKFYFGLPGNPVSCSVTSLLFVIPTLRYLERNRSYNWPVIRVSGKFKNNDERPEYHRVLVKVDPFGTFSMTSTGNQISSRLNSMVNANGLAVVKGKKNENTKTMEETSSNFDVLLVDDLLQ